MLTFVDYTRSPFSSSFCLFLCELSLVKKNANKLIYVLFFDLFLYVPSTFFQLNRDVSSWVEPVLS